MFAESIERIRKYLREYLTRNFRQFIDMKRDWHGRSVNSFDVQWHK